MSAVVASLLTENQDTSPMLTSSGGLRSTSTEDGLIVDRIRLRVSYGGQFVQDAKGKWRYQGGDTFLESVPHTWHYSDFIFRLVEKTGEAVAVKFVVPGEELDPDSLISVADDRDMQEMRDEYQRCLRAPGTPIKTFRLRVLLFPAAEEEFTLEEIEDGEQFFSRSSADRLVREKGGGGCGVGSAGRASTSRAGVDAGRSTYSSALSSGSASQADSATGVAPDHPEVDAWQAGFEAGQEAAAWARLPSDSFDADTNGDALRSPMEDSKSTSTPHSQVEGKEQAPPHAVAITAESALPGFECGAFDYWQGPENYDGFSGEDDGLTLAVGAATQGLPSHISAFESTRSGTSAGPLSPAVPPVADLVSAGVRLPSHISAFGDNSDDRLDELHSSRFDGKGMAEVLQPLRCEPPGSDTTGFNRTPSVTVSSPNSLRFPKVHCVPQDDIRVLGRIGEGAFGEVSLAHSPIFGEVAVKWLKPGKHLQRSSESFGGEAEVLASVNHPNVLRFYGIVTQSATDPTCVGIMTEYMRGGSLADLLRYVRNHEGMLHLRQRTEIALGAVKGLAYLHEMRIVHFDLKPDNLLLDNFHGGTVKVADFGLHKHKKEHQSFVSGVHDLRGTLPYMAPELVSDPTHVSEKADVWSLGMVLWEMLTLQVPFSHLTPQQIVAGLMVGNLQPEVPAWCEPAWAYLMERCWEVSPAARPNLRDLVAQLEDILRTIP